MAKYGSDQVAFFLVDGYSLLGSTTDITEDKEAMTEDTTVLGSAWAAEEATGLRKAHVEQKGFYDDAALGVNAALVSSVGVSRVMCYGFEGNVKGKKFVGFAGALQVAFERVASRGELHKANAKYKGNGAVEDGTILHVLATQSVASGNSQATSHDSGAGSANGGSAYLQLCGLTLGGYTNAPVWVQHSVDNVTFTDLVAFTPATVAPSAQRVTVAGTVNRYLAMRWALAGAGSGPSMTWMIGFYRAP